MDTITFWTINRDPARRVLVAVDAIDAWVLGRRWTAQWCRDKLESIRQTCATERESNNLLHRLIMQPGPDMVIDHADGNPANNRRNNLRICTVAQNCRNRGPNRNNKCGLKGVSWDRERGKWFAQIEANSKKRNLGRYPTQQEAHAAYCRAARRLHGEFARTE